LFETIFPSILQEKLRQGGRDVRIWTAACSTGEEPYSIAIAAKEFFKDKPIKVKIFASDINTRVINAAKAGRYNERSLKELSEGLKKKYFSPVDPLERRIKLTAEFALSEDVKKSVEFFQHNLLDRPTQREMDIIFLRNVMIYFNRESKQKVVSNIQDALVPGGYFFISLSESLNDVSSQLVSVYSGIYRKEA
jgi:chemotaxis protein methyltransferase CheR